MGNLSMRRIVALRWWGLLIFSAGLLLLASFYFDAGAQAWIAATPERGAEESSCAA